MARLIPIFSSITKPQPPPITASDLPPPPRILSRRTTVLLSSSAAASSLLLSLTPSDPASAFSLGICTHTTSYLTLRFFQSLSPISILNNLNFYAAGPKEWLKDQKKKSSRFLLAPIDASREALRSAYLSVTSGKSDYTDKDLENLQNLFKSSARDCVPKERSSIVDFQSKTGVEVCTFKLVVKNAASLLDDKDPLKLEAENILNDLVRSFGSLIVLTNGIDMNLPSDRKKIADAVMEAISYLDKFEKGVKDCLEI